MRFVIVVFKSFAGFRYRPRCFPPNVLAGSYRVVEQHSGAGPAHDGADAFFHVFAVAVYGALLAGGLVVAEFAVVQPLEGVIQ